MAAQFASTKHDGLVDIRDSMVHVTSPTRGGIPAAISPCKGLKLYVNGVLAERVVFVEENDQVVVVPIEIKGGMSAHVKIDESEMQAWLDFHPDAHILYRPKDKLPSNLLELEADEIVMRLVPPQMEDLQVILHNAGVCYGIDQATIKQIVEKPEVGQYLIASGKPPIMPVDDTWSLLGKADMERVSLEEDSSGRVDFHQQISVPTIDIGQIVAQLHEGIDGVDGVTVTGKPIPAGKRKVLSVQENQFVRTDATGSVYAKKIGRLRYEEKNDKLLFCIQDLLEVDAVDMSIGNLNFNGDIQILGSVEDTMEVKCIGNMSIGGTVSFAKLIAGDSILVRGGLNSSTLEAGKLDVQIRAAQYEIDTIRLEMHQVIANLRKRPVKASSEFPSVLSQLLNSEHRLLTKQVIALIRNIRSGRLGLSESLAIELMDIFKPLVGDCHEITSIADLESLSDRFEALFHQDILPHPKGEVTITHAVNSTIDAGGDVHIIGNGCSNTTIYSDGKVEIAKFFRGGEIYAGSHVNIGEAGSEMGTKTIIHVTDGARVYFKHVYPDTEVHSGKRIMTFQRERNNVQVTYSIAEGFKEESQFGRKR